MTPFEIPKIAPQRIYKSLKFLKAKSHPIPQYVNDVAQVKHPGI